MFLVLILVLMYFLAGLMAVIVLTRSLVRREISLAWKIGAPLGLAFVVWAIPYGDHMLGKYLFNKLCGEEAGYKSYRVVNDVEGYRSDISSENSLRELGYKLVERVNRDGIFDRFALLQNGETQTLKNVRPKSRYLIDRSQAMLGMHIGRSRYTIIEVETNEVLAEWISFWHEGGWLNRQLSGMHAYRNSCPKTRLDYGEFIRATLRPAR